MTAPTPSSDTGPELSKGSSATGFVAAPVVLSYEAHVQLRWEASYWHRQHERAVKRARWVEQRHRHEIVQSQLREAALQAEVAKLKAQVRDLRQRVFGVRTEQSCFLMPDQRTESASAPRRRRGQQPGKRGHGRRMLAHLPERIEEVQLQTPGCPRCGLALGSMPGVESCEVLEMEVRAYRRTVRRHRWRPMCRCGCLPGIVSAPPLPQLIPRGKLGVSVWVQALLSKFLYGQPTHRLLADWREQGLHIAQGTLTDGLRKLAPLFVPLAQAGLQRLRTHAHWHADETRWEVFVEREGKVGHRWYLWVFQGEDAVHYVLDPSRSASVPTTVLEGVVDGGILSVDRYAAYQKFARQTDGIELAYCWAHQRRDFLNVARDHPQHWGWAMAWAARIGQLYRLHAERRRLFGVAGVGKQGAAFVVSDQAVRAAILEMAQLRDRQLGDAALETPARKALQNLAIYWEGLTLFVEHPQIDLDNNAAERALRLAVVARKNFYGSGSEWSAALAADLLSVLMTARCWKLNVRMWLHQYLQACADAGGRVPSDLRPFVPWCMDAQRLASLRRPGHPGEHLERFDTS